MKTIPVMSQVFKKMIHRYFYDEEATILAILIAASVVAFYFFGKILAPVLASFVFAYLLIPFSNRLIKLGIPYGLANVLVFLVFMGSLLFIILGIVPMVVRQTSNFAADAPKILQDVVAQLQLLPLNYPEYFNETIISHWSSYLNSNSVGETLVSWVVPIIQASFQSVPNILAVGVYVLIVPVLVFFIMKERRYLLEQLEWILPKRRSLLNKIGNEMNQQITNYISGKLLEIVIVGVVSYGVFSFLGLKYTALLAVIIGFSVLVPYVGAIAVTLPVATIALFQWGFGPEFMYAILAYGILQMLDGNVLVPLIFSEAVNLSATAIIVAVLFFGGLWGFWGVFFAIPLATLLKAIMNAWPTHPEETVEP